MSEAFTDEDYERVVRERDEALARIDSQRSQIAFYRTACTARFLPEGFGDETIRELINDLMEDRDDARSTIEDLNDEIARGREAIRIYRTETEAAKRERDEAQARVLDAALIHAELVRERDEARREADRLRHGNTIEGDFVCPHEQAYTEARASRWHAIKELDEARAEVERLKREVSDARIALKAQEHRDQWLMAQSVGYGFYKRGAEAMREACQQWCRAWENDGEAIADALADLSIPEEP